MTKTYYKVTVINLAYVERLTNPPKEQNNTPGKAHMCTSTWFTTKVINHNSEERMRSSKNNRFQMDRLKKP
jgi:hypothetical protein